MRSGVTGGGKLDATGVQNALVFAHDVGIESHKGLTAQTSENDLWTNRYIGTAGVN